jgi:hypothetical protein
MMKSKLLLLLSLSAATYVARAQEAPKADPPLTITGSVDTYYKYDFSGHNNIPTSFASDQNSFSTGMVDIGLKKKVGKASFVGEVSFGPRSDQSLFVPANHIQNLYVGYDITDKFNVTAGFMATFVGYEVISPAGNFNYSTSYLFTNGPFQNSGVKFTYAFSDKVSLMAGVFNDQWNVYTSTGRINTFGAQLMVAPVKGWTAYLNLVAGPASGTEFDLTTTYQITDAFKLGLNAADFTAPGTGVKGGFTGVAIYPQVAVSSAVTLGLRGEYFKTKTGAFTSAYAPIPGESVTGLTFTANIKGGPLTFIPEVRLDNASKLGALNFTDDKGAATKSASQFSLAAVYAF